MTIRTDMPCHICKISDTKLRTLEKLSQMLRKINTTEKWQCRWQWHTSMFCKYGIGSCHKLHDITNRCDAITREIEPKLAMVANRGDDRTFMECMHMLRGEFPNIYKEMEKQHNLKKKIKMTSVNYYGN